MSIFFNILLVIFQLFYPSNKKTTGGLWSIVRRLPSNFSTGLKSLHQYYVYFYKALQLLKALRLLLQLQQS